MADTSTEGIKQRMVDEIAAEPQGTRDTEMPPPPPTPGQVGLDPADSEVPTENNDDTSPTGTGTPDTRTGEEPDPGVFNAGGVDNPDADGTTRSTGRD